jgi:hypothetical protein
MGTINTQSSALAFVGADASSALAECNCSKRKSKALDRVGTPLLRSTPKLFFPSPK